jgi:hypothetical protein
MLRLNRGRFAASSSIQEELLLFQNESLVIGQGGVCFKGSADLHFLRILLKLKLKLKLKTSLRFDRKLIRLVQGAGISTRMHKL